MEPALHDAPRRADIPIVATRRGLSLHVPLMPLWMGLSNLAAAALVLWGIAGKTHSTAWTGGLLLGSALLAALGVVFLGCSSACAISVIAMRRKTDCSQDAS
jgi:hypothetical protein